MVISATSVTTSSDSVQLDKEPEILVLEKVSREFNRKMVHTHASGCDVRKLMDLITAKSFISYAPDVLHYIGHGQIKVLIKDEQGQRSASTVPLELSDGVPIMTRNSAGPIFDHAPLLDTIYEANRVRKCRLLVLQCCKSLQLARDIALRSPEIIVLCWGSLLLDSACESFTYDFYNHLLQRVVRKDDNDEEEVSSVDILHAFLYACRHSECSRGLLLMDPEIQKDLNGGANSSMGLPILVAGQRVSTSTVLTGSEDTWSSISDAYLSRTIKEHCPSLLEYFKDFLLSDPMVQCLEGTGGLQVFLGKTAISGVCFEEHSKKILELMKSPLACHRDARYDHGWVEIASPQCEKSADWAMYMKLGFREDLGQIRVSVELDSEEKEFYLSLTDYNQALYKKNKQEHACFREAIRILEYMNPPHAQHTRILKSIRSSMVISIETLTSLNINAMRPSKHPYNEGSLVTPGYKHSSSGGLAVSSSTHTFSERSLQATASATMSQNTAQNRVFQPVAMPQTQTSNGGHSLPHFQITQMQSETITTQNPLTSVYKRRNILI